MLMVLCCAAGVVLVLRVLLMVLCWYCSAGADVLLQYLQGSSVVERTRARHQWLSAQYTQLQAAVLGPAGVATQAAFSYESFVRACSVLWERRTVPSAAFCCCPPLPSAALCCLLLLPSAAAAALCCCCCLCPLLLQAVFMLLVAAASLTPFPAALTLLLGLWQLLQFPGAPAAVTTLLPGYDMASRELHSTGVLSVDPVDGAMVVRAAADCAAGATFTRGLDSGSSAELLLDTGRVSAQGCAQGEFRRVSSRGVSRGGIAAGECSSASAAGG